MSDQPQTVTILGHCNTTLSVLIDMIASALPSIREVTIVSNIPEAANRLHHVPFGGHGIAIRELQSEEWTPVDGDTYCIASMGTKTRTAIYRHFLQTHQIEANRYRSLIHPFTAIGHEVALGDGTIINPGVVIAPYATLGTLSYINRNASIGHHSSLGSLTTVNPGATIAGMCRIGNGVSIGAGATILDNISIGNHAIVGAGALVTKDVPEGVVVYGSPATIIRKTTP